METVHLNSVMALGEEEDGNSPSDTSILAILNIGWKQSTWNLTMTLGEEGGGDRPPGTSKMALELEAIGPDSIKTLEKRNPLKFSEGFFFL